MPALLPRPQGAALARTGERRDLAQASPRGSRRRGGSAGEEQRQSPPRPAILPPPWDLPLPSFPPSLIPEVERRGARRRALRGPGKHDRSSRARGASQRIAWDSPLLQGREASFPGERPVRFAPAPSVSSPASSCLSSCPRLRGLTHSPPRRASNQEAAAAASRAATSRRQPSSSPNPSADSRAFRTPGAWCTALRRALWVGCPGARGAGAQRPHLAACSLLPVRVWCAGRLGSTPGASQKGKGSWVSALKHLRHGRRAWGRLESW